MFDQSLGFNEQFIIHDLTYIPMGSYLPVLNRPYVVNATTDAIETISERLYDSRSGKITPNIINGVANDIIRPSTTGFDGGLNQQWVGTRRFIFMLKVATIDAAGMTYNTYLQGYTDYDGITPNGNADPRLNHHVNSIIETCDMTINTPLGIYRKEKINKIYNVMGSVETAGYDVETFAQRPGDILDNISALNIDSLGEGQYRTFMAKNTLNQFNQRTLGSSVENDVTTQYVSKLLTTGLLTNKNQDIMIDSMGSLTGTDEPRGIEEPSIYNNRFMKYLGRLSGERIAKKTFQFQTLFQIDPTIDARFRVLNITKDYVDFATSSTPETGEYWNGQDPATLKAYSLIENSVALATRCGFNKLYFIASNRMSPTGEISIYITNFNSYINLDENEINILLELFKERYITDIFINESNSGNMPLHVEGYVDLLGTSKIKLAYGYFPETWYTIPTFANSLFSPILTLNKDTLDYTTMQFMNVIDSISNNQMSQHGFNTNSFF